MTDTQWPRWEVFQQTAPNQPFRNAGSVHAPDAEMALENARDVFVRRPACADFYVVRADQILTRTLEELAASLQPAPIPEGAATEPYLVFCKQTQRAAETYVTQIGEVEARTPTEALNRAIEKYGGLNPFVWWVCPAGAAARPGPSESASLLAQMNSKPYRQPQYYRVVADMQKYKTAKS